MVRILKKRGRDRLHVVAEILDIAEEGVLKTQIMYRANLSYTLLTDYLRFMLKSRLLEKRTYKGQVVFKSTPKGINFLQRYREITDIIHAEEEGESEGEL